MTLPYKFEDRAAQMRVMLSSKDERCVRVGFAMALSLLEESFLNHTLFDGAKTVMASVREGFNATP